MCCADALGQHELLPSGSAQGCYGWINCATLPNHASQSSDASQQFDLIAHLIAIQAQVLHSSDAVHQSSHRESHYLAALRQLCAIDAWQMQSVTDPVWVCRFVGLAGLILDKLWHLCHPVGDSDDQLSRGRLELACTLSAACQEQLSGATMLFTAAWKAQLTAPNSANTIEKHPRTLTVAAADSRWLKAGWNVKWDRELVGDRELVALKLSMAKGSDAAVQ